MKYSIIIPIYNRPEELDQLLESILNQKAKLDVEVIVVEDGSTITSKEVVDKYASRLNLTYFVKANSGPGDSRNFGMQKATGDYFIIFDSDCILPIDYLEIVDKTLQESYTQAYGGPDRAHPSFNSTQKAISYSMTSMLTTGGLRGHDKLKSKFQLRSFNMGLSRDAFNSTKGYAKQRFGEDIDLTFRLWQHNQSTQFISDAFVYHKRRSNWPQFFNQTFNFGAARPILNNMYPASSKPTFWFPSVFVMASLFALILSNIGIEFPLALVVLYLICVALDASIKNRSVMVGLKSVIATIVQFYGYGLGFLRSWLRLNLLNQSKEKAFPKMFS